MALPEPLVALERLRIRTGMHPQEAQWDPTLTEALRIGKTEAENFLHVELSVKTNDDLFDLQTSNFKDRLGKDGLYTLVLRNRFVSNVQVILTLLDGETVEVASACRIDDSKGVVRVPCSLAHRYIQVTYTSGVTKETCPDWLQDVILSFATLNFALPDTDKQAGSQNDRESLVRTYEHHHRQVPFAIRPIA